MKYAQGGYYEIVVIGCFTKSFPCENLGMRPSLWPAFMSAMRECRLFPKCTEDDRACRKGFSPGALLSVPFLGKKKGDNKREKRGQ